MKNITVSVPDDVYQRARVHAAENGTSVSRMVIDFLWTAADRDLELEEAARKRDEIVASIKGFSATDRLSRDEVHERAALR
ncbi:MAG: DUF6364 family protein [Microbacterium sp.]